MWFFNVRPTGVVRVFLLDLLAKRTVCGRFTPNSCAAVEVRENAFAS